MDEKPLVDKKAFSLETYFPHAYKELKRLAFTQLKSEKGNHTLNATGLVHELYLKLAKQERQLFDSKGHFFLCGIFGYAENFGKLCLKKTK